MNSSGYWDQSSINHSFEGGRPNELNPANQTGVFASSQPELQLQAEIPQDELLASITSASANNETNHFFNEDESNEYDQNVSNMPNQIVEENSEDLSVNNTTTHNNTTTESQNNPEMVQQIYYQRGLEELESLQLLDLSPLANWKLSSFKQGFGLAQLRDDSPDTYWQSDASNGSGTGNSNAIMNNQLSNPHSVTIQFSKKVSLERISIFTNFQLDESYTPSRIQILAGSSDGWDLTEVCTVNFTKPMGWSHIIFNGIRSDGVLKCFMVKIIILANHQDGKDSHIRAIRCFGKKSTQSKSGIVPAVSRPNHSDLLNDLSLNSGLTNLSGFLLNNRIVSNISDRNMPRNVELYQENHDSEDQENYVPESSILENHDVEVKKVATNVDEVIGFNTGFQSIQMRSISNIR